MACHCCDNIVLGEGSHIAETKNANTNFCTRLHEFLSRSGFDVSWVYILHFIFLIYFIWWWIAINSGSGSNRSLRILNYNKTVGHSLDSFRLILTNTVAMTFHILAALYWSHVFAEKSHHASCIRLYQENEKYIMSCFKT